MMPPEQLGEISVAKLLAGIAGSFVSLRFMPGTRIQKATLVVGGSIMAYYATTPFTQWVGMQDADARNLVCFFIGMFGMAIASKVYEVIQAVDAKAMADDARAWVKRMLGV